jgi:hypothetical protein
MVLAEVKRIGRRAGVAVAVAGLIAGPAFAFVAMGGGHGFHGGGFHGSPMHGGFHGPPAPPGIVALKPPLFAVAPPMHIHDGFFVFHDNFHDHFHDNFHDHFHHHDRFGDRTTDGGFWGGGYGVYPTGYSEQAYVAEPAGQAPAAEPAPCPELLTWSPKLGRATRQDLCGDARTGAMAGG